MIVSGATQLNYVRMLKIQSCMVHVDSTSSFLGMQV